MPFASAMTLFFYCDSSGTQKKESPFESGMVAHRAKKARSNPTIQDDSLRELHPLALRVLREKLINQTAGVKNCKRAAASHRTPNLQKQKQAQNM